MALSEADNAKIDQVFKEFKESSIPNYLVLETLISGNVLHLQIACVQDDGKLDDSEKELLNWYWDHLGKLRSDKNYVNDVMNKLNELVSA